MKFYIRMKIGIIGSGLTGLSAALNLADKHDVIIFEKNDTAGGCMSSKKYDNYTLETLYHHCFSGDKELLSLIKSLMPDNELIWLKGSTGYYADGKLEGMTTPIEILKWSGLSFFEKIKLGLFVLSSRKIDSDELDKITAKEYLLDKVGRNIYTAFFEPLLTSKFGVMKEKVSAAWLMSRIAIRSDRGAEGERLGYLKGGWHNLIDSICSELNKKGCEIRLNTTVDSLIYDDGWIISGEKFDAVISTIPPQITKSMISGVDLSIPDLKYQGAACLTLGIKKDPANHIYWTNMGEPAPYGAVVVHTNFAPYEWYGEHVVYLASYFSGEVPNGIKDSMINDFCSRFYIDKSDILHSDLYIEKYAGPVYITGYKENIPKCDAGHNLFIAGMFSEENYPERSMEGSIRAGIHAAQILEEKN